MATYTETSPGEQDSKVEANQCRKSSAYSLSILLLVLALIGGLLLLTSLTSSLKEMPNECRPADELNLLHYTNHLEQIRVPSDDLRSLVKFVGSIRFPQEAASSPDQEAEFSGNDERTPLELKSVEWSDGNILRLVTNCARLSLYTATDGKQLVVSSMMVETTPLNGVWSTCSVSYSNIMIRDKTRYRFATCNKSRPSRHECRKSFETSQRTYRDMLVAELYIHSLEFELEGNAALIRANRFSKPAEDCNKTHHE